MAIKPFREAAVYPPDAFPPTLIILKNMLMLRPLLLIFLILLSGRALQAQRQLEDLGRGVVAVHQGAGKVYVGWRMLGTDPADIAFNLYRTTGKGKPLRLNRQPLTASTNFTDQVPDLGQGNAYFVRPVVKGKEQEASAAFTLPAQAPVQPYLSIPLHPIAGYTPNDASAADLDGDGEYEIVLHQTGRGRDTPSNGLTDEPIFQAYKLDGTLLWTINLGRNIREGAHYTQFIVIDMDGDGKAEFACKTADGTKDGKGTVIGEAAADWREEVILRTTDNKELRIFTTTIPTEVRMPTLMHDPQYRLAVAWQNVAYNQPPHPSFHIGAGMKPVRQVPITVGNRKQAKAAATPTNTKTAKNR
jgi:hypothetical protein